MSEQQEAPPSKSLKQARLFFTGPKLQVERVERRVTDGGDGGAGGGRDETVGQQMGAREAREKAILS